MWKLWILLLINIYRTASQVYNCPSTWRAYGQSCYFFNYAPQRVYTEALADCHVHGASLLSVNDVSEHNFIGQQLRIEDATGYLWYTSGIVNNLETGDLKWEGDGTEIKYNDQWWHSEEDRLKNYRRIVYKNEGGLAGWSRVPMDEVLPYICEINQAEAYRINQDERDFTYGSNISDPRTAPRGPVFIIQPQSVVVATSRSDLAGNVFTTNIECFADGNPLPSYRIYHTNNNGSLIEITSATDSRYTITGGRLVIKDPINTIDGGQYQCQAENQYGIVLSDYATLTFGVLESFSNVQRAPVVANEYQSAVIECNPPPYVPAANFQWSRGTTVDYVRPDLNPYMFLSNNGKLYFSEVTQSDETDYYCMVMLGAGSNSILNTDQPPSMISLPIPLVVRHSVPATWGPIIADGFIASFPNRPLRGDTIELECLAYGTLPLRYSWSRDYYPMPDSAEMSDHNRKLTIRAAQLEDTGTYRCNVARTTGIQVHKDHHLVIEAKPYFVFPLQNQHADINSQLTWRCEAKAIPKAYFFWIKNGQHISHVPGDVEIQSNVMVIRSVEPRHEGVYQCMAINTHGVTYSTAQLRVLAFAPTFAKRPLSPSTSAAIGSDVTIICSPEAAPKPAYSWSKNGMDLNLPENDETSRVRKLANGNLYISDVQMMDAGTYTCVATNEFGMDSSSGQFRVVSNTIITQPPLHTVGRINMTSVLMCQASFPGYADNIYQWQFNGRSIDTNIQKNYRLGSDTLPGALYVTSAQYDHSGTYTCVAKTTYDVTTASATLLVEGPPGEPAGVRVDVTTITTTSATVVWITGNSHGRLVEFHTIEANTEHNLTWVPVAINIPVTLTQILGSDKHAFRLEELKPGNGYHFRVRGINSLGVGKASSSSIMYRIPGAPPTKYPDNVGGGGGSVGLLTITWTPLSPEDRGAPGIGYIINWRKNGTATKFMEARVEGDQSFYAVTVGQENYYLPYEVQVRAFNSLGQGPVSPEGVVAYSAEDIPIGVATNVYAWPFNSTALWVSWDIVPNDRAHMRGTLLGYQVNFQLRFEADASLDAISWRGETENGVVVGLDPFTYYTVDVQILNTAGMGPRSEVFHAKTYKQAPRYYPTEVFVWSHTSESVRITWRGVQTEAREENLEGYKVRYWQTTDDVRVAQDIVVDRLQTETLIHGIQKDIVYQLRVLGYSRGGDGKHSKVVYFTLGGMVAFDPSSSEILSSSSKLFPAISATVISLLFSLILQYTIFI